MQDGRATGVRYLRDGMASTLWAGSEVFLCGGSVNTPQLLMRSGIGPAGHLSEQGIECRVDLAGVGSNLQDHLFAAVIALSADGVAGSLLAAESNRNLAAWAFRGRGMLSSNVGEALAHVAGYTISHDVSERELQLERGGQWTKGKSADTFNPLGPFLATPDEVPDPQALGLTLDANGERRQRGNTRDMAFGVEHLVWYVSQFMALEGGDVLSTGTPAGVGLGLKPPRFLAPGDICDLEIDGLGRQRQLFEREP